MQFTKRLREPIMRGEVTCSVRIWQRARVKVGGVYSLGSGAIEVTSVRHIELGDITPALARKSGFLGVVDLLKVAKHGPGENVYLVEFVFRDAPQAPKRAKPSAMAGSTRTSRGVSGRARRKPSIARARERAT